jgi:Ca2+-binding RTX toxin-like protein
VGSLDTHTVVIDWGDGNSTRLAQAELVERTFIASHRYLDDDPTGTPWDDYDITVTVTDDDTGAHSSFADVKVYNVAPVFSSLVNDAEVPGDVLPGEPVTISGTFADPGSVDVHAVIVDWGDETMGEHALAAVGDRDFSITHDYANPDIYQISVSIRDDDGAVSPVGTTEAFLGGAALRDGELIVLTTPGNDVVSITESAGAFTVVTAFPQRSVTKTFDVVDVESISVQMFGGQDTLQLVGAGLADSYVVTPDTVFWNDLPAGHFGVETVEIYGGDGADEFFVRQTDSSIETRLFGGLGDDSFDVGNGASVAAAGLLPGAGGTLSGISGLVTINGGEGGSDTLNVDNTAEPGPDAGELTATTITGLGMRGAIHYSNIETLELSLGSGGNLFDITGTMRREGENTQTVVNTGSGNDRVTASLDAAIDGPLQVNLQAGNDEFDGSASNLGVLVSGGDGHDYIAAGAGADILYGDDGQDVLIGGAGSDRIDGGADEDLIFGDEARLDRTTPLAAMTNPRYRQLLDGELYGTGLDSGKNALVTDFEQAVPGGAAVWEDFEITLLDHGDADEAAGPTNFGDDYIAGGADGDQIFGQLGNDTIQGDGSLATGASASRDGSNNLILAPSMEAATDGDDYIEGNGGSDVIFGNLGQDDIIGGSSNLFSLTDPNQRPDGADLIFGGAGTDVDRNDAGDGSHGGDSDMILGDNGNIFRLLDATGEPLSFNYDDGYGEQIVVRAAELLDYTLGGPDKVPGSADIGAGDELHGESGDDFIYGMKGSDVLFGEGQDDDLIGGWGHDWMSGGTGSDGMLGDDGRIFTGRNSAVYGEPLYGVDRLAATDPDSKFNNGDVLNEEISTPGDVQYAIINVAGELKKSVDLTPFNVMENGDFKGDAQYADDSMYGGLDDDWMHGGSGDDAMSGAEALASFYNNPVPMADVLAYSATTGEFAAYDEYEPLTRIGGFLLDFLAAEGENLGMADGRIYYSDGDDRIFGDLGNDWIVGGTGRDNMYGGWGDDLLDADDDHATNGGLNDAADTHRSYEDIAYGGAGRDRLIANAVEDRLIDWAGQFNSFILPFPSVGHGTVTGSMQPHLAEFLYALSEGDGVDLTLAATGDPRNGEPFGELGVVRRQDADWQDQTGAPADIAFGSIPAGKREVLRATSFDDDTFEGFFADSGTWTVQGAVLQVAAESLGSDAVSVYHLGEEQLPGYFEVLASIRIEKPTAGWKGNAFVVFDYQGPQDFKFAGIDDSENKLVMGHRDATGWHTDVQAPVKGGVKYDTYYNMLVAINGVNVTLVVDNKEVFQHTYAPRIEDGYAFGLNAGMVGVGSDNSRGWFDNIRVQVLPPQLTFDNTENFEDDLADLFTMGTTGVWSVSDGRYRVDPGIDPSTGGSGISLLDPGPDNLNFNSYLELNSVVNTQSRAGFVFDRYGEDSFKFVAIDAGADQLIIGHYTGKAGWVNDAVVSTVIDAVTDYVLGVALKGTTANATLKGVGNAGYRAIVGHTFNAATVDGNFGLLATGGSANFDDIRIKTDDPAFAGNLMASAAPQTLADSEGMLTSDSLKPIVDEAIARWTETLGVDDALVAALHDVSFQIVDFNDLTLGRAIGDTILIDADAAGFGWFIDDTPADNVEFGLQLSDGELQAIGTSEAFGRMDLLTVVMHELGHVLGLEDLDPAAHDVMSETLDAGDRHVPAAAEQERIQEDLINLVAMDLEPETGVSEGSFPAAITSARNGWLLDFLSETAKRPRNPYEPNDEDGIRIVLFDNKNKEDA